MAQTKVTLDQLEPTTISGSIVASNTSNDFAILPPTTGANHLWGYNHSTTLSSAFAIGAHLTSTGATLAVDTTGFALLAATQTFTGTNTFDQNIILNGTPTLNSHGVNKAYVDGIVLDRRSTSVDVATTANITLSGEQTIDTVSTSSSTVLVKNQTNHAENGIYISAAGAWTRATIMDTAGEVQGVLALVEAGGQQGQIWYTLSSVSVLGTDPIDFVKLATGVIDGSGSADRITFWSDSDTLSSSSTFKFASNQMVIGDTAYEANTVFTTKGTTTNNTAWGYAHKDSAGTVKFKVSNTGVTTIGSGSSTVTLSSTAFTGTDSGGFVFSTSNGNLSLGAAVTTVLQGGGTSATTPSVSANIPRNSTTSNQVNFEVLGTFSPVGAGTNTFTDLDVKTVINQTTHTGDSYSVHIHPTLTSVLGNYSALRITASGQTALHTTAGYVRFDLGSDADYDTYFRAASTGRLSRLANGLTGQVLVATTGSAPSWGNIPAGTHVDECFVENQATNTIDLDANTGVVKDVDGNNIAFTVPSNLELLKVYLNGQLLHRTGTLTNRDYTVNTSTNVLTLTSALVASDRLYIYKHG